MVKIAFLHSELMVGGAEQMLQNVMSRMDRIQLEPLVATLYNRGVIGEMLESKGLKVHSHMARSKWDPFVGYRLMRLFKKENVKVIYVGDSALPMFWAGWIRRRNPQIKLVIAFHSTGKIGNVIQFAIANRMVFPVADRFIALAETHREFLCKTFKLSKDKFSIVACCIDSERFQPAEDKGTAKKAVGIEPDAPIVGIVAALRPEKNHSLFIKMAATLHSKFPKAKFIIVGDGTERAGLEDEAKEQGATDYVIFLGSRKDTPDLYNAMDVDVLCSHPVIETFPQVLLEAQACAVPVVSTDVGSIRDVIADGETGFLVPQGDINALSYRVEQLLNDADLRKKMGQAARERAVRLFKIEDMVSGYEKIFLEAAQLGDNTK
jgi:glycosyltransferase involved in cell wall biosynthesis